MMTPPNSNVYWEMKKLVGIIEELAKLALTVEEVLVHAEKVFHQPLSNELRKEIDGCLHKLQKVIPAVREKLE